MLCIPSRSLAHFPFLPPLHFYLHLHLAFFLAKERESFDEVSFPFPNSRHPLPSALSSSPRSFFLSLMNTADNQKGLALALSSSVFIGSSFIVKKKGLMRARSSGFGAGKERCHFCCAYPPLSLLPPQMMSGHRKFFFLLLALFFSFSFFFSFFFSFPFLFTSLSNFPFLAIIFSPRFSSFLLLLLCYSCCFLLYCLSSAGDGGYAYLKESLWWIGLMTSEKGNEREGRRRKENQKEGNEREERRRKGN